MMTLVETKTKVEMKTTMVRVFLVIGQIIFLKCFFAKWTTWFLVDSLVMLHFRLALKFLFTNITCQLSFVPTSSFMHNNIVFSRITSATITTKIASICNVKRLKIKNRNWKKLKSCSYLKNLKNQGAFPLLCCW